MHSENAELRHVALEEHAQRAKNNKNSERCEAAEVRRENGHDAGGCEDSPLCSSIFKMQIIAVDDSSDKTLADGCSTVEAGSTVEARSNANANAVAGSNEDVHEPHVAEHTGEEDRQEDEWKAALTKVQNEIKRYQRAKREGNKEEKEEAARNIPEYMRRAGDLHTDPDVKAKFYRNAEEFAAGDDEARDKMLHPFVQGLIILLAAPFAVAAGIIYGTGKLIEGIGKALTIGPAAAWRALRR
ncbi:hypothetical protein A0H81_11049 [Grifola frondosa]|uniref:Transmembrane protein n=1 Tax=Grifola frondosa TaxID=5627 RepID=A0A1C7LY50_GRIFR|nr:hypothetical protein A0H81_11049 [Grifola frondosa]